MVLELECIVKVTALIKLMVELRMFRMIIVKAMGIFEVLKTFLSTYIPSTSPVNPEMYRRQTLTQKAVLSLLKG